MNNITKYLKYVALVVGALGFFFFIRILMVGNINEDKLLAGDPDTVAKNESLHGIVDGFMTTTYVVLGIIIALILIFSIWNLLKNPKALKKAMMAIGLLVIVFIIAYVFADSSEVITKKITAEEGSSLSKMVSTGINFSLLLGALAFLGFIFDTVKTLIKS